MNGITTNENTNRNSTGSDATTDASLSQPLQKTQQQSPSNLTYSLISRKIATVKTTNDHSQNIDDVLGKRGDSDSVTSGSLISGSTSVTARSRKIYKRIDDDDGDGDNFDDDESKHDMPKLVIWLVRNALAPEFD